MRNGFIYIYSKGYDLFTQLTLINGQTRISPNCCIILDPIFVNNTDNISDQRIYFSAIEEYLPVPNNNKKFVYFNDFYFTMILLFCEMT